MKITVIGTINKDLILPFRGRAIESLGGIFFTTTVLSELLDDHDQIIPISYVGSDLMEQVQVILSKRPNVAVDGLIPIEQKNHKVILEYISPDERREKALFNFPPLEWKQVKKFMDADAVMVNMITGWDLSLKAFQKIGKKHRGCLYLDVHFLLMGIDDLGRRFPKRPEDVEKWIKIPRILQMNEKEFRIISPDSLSEVEFHRTFLRRDQILLVTKGAKGATIVAEQKGILARRHFPAYRIREVVDVTGCGDVFGAAFLAAYLKGKSLDTAVDYANLMAAANATLPGTTEMHRLKNAAESVRKYNRKK